MTHEEINEIVFSNYEDLRNELIKKYNLYTKAKDNNSGMFHSDIDRNFMQMVNSFITSYIVQRNCNIPINEIKCWVEDKFTWDNIERILSDEGAF